MELAEPITTTTPGCVPQLWGILSHSPVPLGPDPALCRQRGAVGADPFPESWAAPSALALPAGNPLREFQRESAVIHSSVTNGLPAVIPKLYPHFHLLSLRANGTQKKKRKNRGRQLIQKVRKVALVTVAHP